MSITAVIIILASFFTDIAVPVQQENDIPVGQDLRVVDKNILQAVFRIIKYRIDTNLAAEPLLIFSPYSDPDVLGLIATDDSLPLEYREVAGNAILDQLYTADAYFRVNAEHYLEILANSPERSLRLKGMLGQAMIEHWRYILGRGAEEDSPRILRLQLYALSEKDDKLRSFLEQIAGGDVSELVGSAAWSPEVAAKRLYRRFDSIPQPEAGEVEVSQTFIKNAWEQYRTITALNDELQVQENSDGDHGSVVLNVLSELKSLNTMDLKGFLSRYQATLPMQEGNITYPQSFLDFFFELAQRRSDPYLRSLALGPLSAASSDQAIEFLLDRLHSDESPLVRVSAAYLLKKSCSGREVRNRIIALFRTEEDPRVRLEMLHSLVWPFQDNPPPDVQAFFFSRLDDQRDEDILEFVVFILGNSNVRNAAGAFSRLLENSTNPVLRARVAEAMNRIGVGRKIQTIPKLQ